MSPADGSIYIDLEGGPRASGDEPKVITKAVQDSVWSPRERG